MTQMMANEFTSASRDEDNFNLVEPVSVVCVSVDEETWRFLGLFANSTGLIQLRTRVGEYRDTQDQDAFLQSMASAAPDICLIDFDKDRQSAAVVPSAFTAGFRAPRYLRCHRRLIPRQFLKR
jgi:hypothetical protein